MDKYKDMLDMEYKKSNRRPHMSLHDRAAQFSPFAALTGHEEAIEETARITEVEIELDEDAKAKLNERIVILKNNLDIAADVVITYFVKDEIKAGGEYTTVKGVVRKVDDYRNVIVMEVDENRIDISFNTIIKIEGILFDNIQ